ncbi:hypothetical protein [Halobacterium sp. KA-6]|uniref:hypothetical protein n=1 Tax=Halobacterium sp. KA-6 TaxID=2896368 RepID=UPI001E2DF439|nr:hypothetical protein [Halobacterium sp. KA-6]MCD2204636.1 hypothetical protein [Halobacterium sp. KA-6]
MASDSLRTAALRYGVVAGPVTVALLAGVAVLVDFPLKLLGVLTLGVPLLVVPAVVGATDAGIETAAGSALVGAEAGDPSDHQPDRIPPFRTRSTSCAGCPASASPARSCWPPPSEHFQFHPAADTELFYRTSFTGI